MSIEEIQKHYWYEIIQMSEKYNIDPWKLVRVMKNYEEVFLNHHPNFLAYDLNKVQVTFAETVIEGVPVFKWDIVYSLNGDQYTVLDKIDALGESITILDENSEDYTIKRSQLILKSPMVVFSLHKRDIEVILSVFNNFDTRECGDDYVEEIRKVEKTLKEFTK